MSSEQACLVVSQNLQSASASSSAQLLSQIFSQIIVQRWAQCLERCLPSVHLMRKKIMMFWKKKSFIWKKKYEKGEDPPLPWTLEEFFLVAVPLSGYRAEVPPCCCDPAAPLRVSQRWGIGAMPWHGRSGTGRRPEFHHNNQRRRHNISFPAQTAFVTWSSSMLLPTS